MSETKERITPAQAKETIFNLLNSNADLMDVLQENETFINDAGIDKTSLLLEIANKYPAYKTNALRLARTENKAIINNTSNFLQRMKDNDPNKYYKCGVFMQDNTKKQATPLNIPRGTLSYIGAMTHRGKTTALISIALDAIEQGQKVYFVTTEETPNQVFIRMIKAILVSNFPQVLQYNNLTNTFYLKDVDDIDERIINFMGTYEKALFSNSPASFKDAVYLSYEILCEYLQKELFTIIDHTQQRTFEELHATLNTLENKSLIVLDYIQHVKKPANSGSDNRQVIIQNESQQLADIAGHKDLIIIAGGQFNRKGNDKQNEQDKYKPDFLEPTLFRESGDIEQDAHLIIGIGQQIHETEVIAGNPVTRFYEILKQRGHKPDANKYKILDNSAFSLYSCINNDGHLQYFASVKQDKTSGNNKKQNNEKKEVLFTMAQ